MSKQQKLREIELEESIVPATGGEGMLGWWWAGGGGAAIILGVIIIIIP